MMDGMKAFLEQFPQWRGHADLIVKPPTPDEAVAEFPDARGAEIVRCGHRRSGGDGGTALASYMRMRRCGVKARLAEMLALRRPPAIMTDSVFFQGMGTLGKQFGEDSRVGKKQLEHYVRMARKHGYNPGPHDVYMPGLARFQGDPEAWVSPADGRGYIRRVCEKRGWGCEGGVNVEAREPETDPWENATPMAEDLIRAKAPEVIKKNPKLRKAEDIRAAVIEAHGPTS